MPGARDGTGRIGRSRRWGRPRCAATTVAVDLDRLDNALTALDEVEATATHLLARIVVTAVDGTEAWADHAARVPATAAPIPVWDATGERRAQRGSSAPRRCVQASSAVHANRGGGWVLRLPG